MKSNRTDELPSHWKLSRGNPDANLVTKGQWTKVDERRCLEGEFYVARRDEDGALIRRGVAINGSVRIGTPYLQLGPDSIFRMRYQTDVPSAGGVSVFLGTRRSNGGFGGNFTSWISEPESRELEDGFREVVIPISEFKLNSKIRERGSDYDLVENALSKILISVPEDRELHVAHVSVENGEVESN
ncbi:MAG: hypothetical protein AAF585_23500 [Verrucomicrobiota bacterium]